MMAAVTYLTAVIVLQGWPVYLFLRARLDGVPVGEAGTGAMALGLGGAALLTLVVLVGSLQVGVRRVGRGEVVTTEGAT